MRKLNCLAALPIPKKTSLKNLIPKESILHKNKLLFTIIIHNLLDNAVKNTAQGSIVFSNYIKDNYTYILVSDTGRGMMPETLEYYQGLTENYDTKFSRKSARLGLQIVIELMLILNGKINIESKENKGTTVKLIFENYPK